MHIPAKVMLVVVLTSSLVMAADPGSPAFTDPDKAGIDFALQGEYLGEIDTDDGRKKIGAQVIALGDGMFRVVGYVGGLPGDGWSRGDEIHSHDGRLNDDSVTFVNEEKQVRSVLSSGRITVFIGGSERGRLTKLTRTSPTLGAKPPVSSIMLFDGRSKDNWENGEITEGRYLAATNVYTKRKFGDHSLHIEFRTPFMPKSTGQARGNSGVYVQSRYEVQVLDSFGLEGRNNECGGIYSIAEPAVNMCLAPLSWQTYDIDFTSARYGAAGDKVRNARITVRHNGAVIHDDVELTQGTPGRHPEGPDPEALFLQDHSDPVVFRNIWVVRK